MAVIEAVKPYQEISTEYLHKAEPFSTWNVAGQ